MGTLTDKFSDLCDVMKMEYQKATATARPGAGGEILLQRLLRPLLPAQIRCGPGTILDVKDREVGPIDVVGCSDGWPPIGDQAATAYLLNGVIFAVQAKDWAVNDLTQFGAMSQQLKNLERQASQPVFCAAFSFTDIPQKEIADFMAAPSGRPVDGVIVLGSHVIIRNSLGRYGDPQKVPFVTERGAGESLKAFAFALVHAAQSFSGQSFGLASYQHL